MTRQQQRSDPEQWQANYVLQQGWLHTEQGWEHPGLEYPWPLADAFSITYESEACHAAQCCTQDACTSWRTHGALRASHHAARKASPRRHRGTD